MFCTILDASENFVNWEETSQQSSCAQEAQAVEHHE